VLDRSGAFGWAQNYRLTNDFSPNGRTLYSPEMCSIEYLQGYHTRSQQHQVAARPPTRSAVLLTLIRRPSSLHSRPNCAEHFTGRLISRLTSAVIAGRLFGFASLSVVSLGPWRILAHGRQRCRLLQAVGAFDGPCLPGLECGVPVDV